MVFVRKIVGKLLREIQRNMAGLSEDISATFSTLSERVKRLVNQQVKDKSKLYALHAPEVECISKGKAKNT